ncbi:MAG: DNA cytosine methyltransferase, partial [Candidatus Fonsibacter sp.]
TCSSVGTKNGTSTSQCRLLFHNLQYVMEKLPRVVIIENVRGLTLKRTAALQAYVRECLRGMRYSIHTHILCTSSPQFPKAAAGATWWAPAGRGFKSPKVVIMAALQNLFDRNKFN